MGAMIRSLLVGVYIGSPDFLKLLYSCRVMIKVCKYTYEADEFPAVLQGWSRGHLSRWAMLRWQGRDGQLLYSS